LIPGGFKAKQVVEKNDCMAPSSPPAPFRLPPRARGGLASFAQGASLPVLAARFLAERPRLWLLCAIPLAINVLIFLVLLTWGYHAFAHALAVWLAGLTAWYWTLVVWLVKILFWFVTLLLVYFIFTPVALLVSSPFNDRLAELTERACGLTLPGDRSSLPRRLLRDTLYVIGAECTRLAFCGLVFVLLLCLNLVPVIGSIAYVGCSFYWACVSLSLEFSSYAADRRRLAWGRKWDLLRRNRALTLGFGAVVTLLLLVPFVNVLMVPVCAVAGTLLFGLMEGEAGH